MWVIDKYDSLTKISKENLSACAPASWIVLLAVISAKQRKKSLTILCHVSLFFYHLVLKLILLLKTIMSLKCCSKNLVLSYRMRWHLILIHIRVHVTRGIRIALVWMLVQAGPYIYIFQQLLKLVWVYFKKPNHRYMSGKKQQTLFCKNITITFNISF